MEEKFTKNVENNKESLIELDDKTQENSNLLKNIEDKSSNFRNNSDTNLKYGKNIVLMYLKNEPFIVIGPDCKILL